MHVGVFLRQKIAVFVALLFVIFFILAATQSFAVGMPETTGNTMASASDLDNDGILDSYDNVTIISVDTELEPGGYFFQDLLITNGANLVLQVDPNVEGFQGVTITAQNLTIEENSSVNSDAQGYSSDNGPGAGSSGVGGSYGGIGGRNVPSSVYGSLIDPLDFGSGGGGNTSSTCLPQVAGAGGGAVILTVRNNLVLNGIISANGEDGIPSPSWGCPATAAGSGGSVYITTNTLEGAGTIRANGGQAYGYAGAGGGGRIAVYGDTTNFGGNIEAYGGQDAPTNCNGGPGTVYLRGEGTPRGDLTIDNNGVSGETALADDIPPFRNISILREAHVYVPIELNCSSMNVEDDSSLEATVASAITISGDFTLIQSSILAPPLLFLNINAHNLSLVNSEIRANVNLSADSLNIDSNSLIAADAQGYPSDTGPGTGSSQVGGSYGGIGGRNVPSSVYGSLIEPLDFGSGGGGNTSSTCLPQVAGAGGGAVILTVRNNLVLNGIISANGEDGIPSPSWGCPATAAGSGGSVYITTNTLEGAGTIRANGGQAYGYAGAGGGGRIAVYGDSPNFSGIIEVVGGEDNVLVGDYAGQEGTVYVSWIQLLVSRAGPDQTVTDTDGDGQEQITLDGSGSDDPGGNIVSWIWTENGNQIATGERPTVTLSVGTHTITLTVTSDDTATDTDETLITIEASSSNLGNLIQIFEATDGEDSQATLTWPNPANSEMVEVVVRRKEGEYPTGHDDGVQVYMDQSPTPGETIEFTDTEVQNAITYFYVAFQKTVDGMWNDFVQEGWNADTARPADPPNARFTCSSISLKVGEFVVFDAYDSNDPDPDQYIQQYKWDFDGDGKYDWVSRNVGISGWQVGIQYREPGTYTVSLEVTSSSGATAKASKQIGVEATSFVNKVRGWIGDVPWPWGDKARKVNDNDVQEILAFLGVHDHAPYFLEQVRNALNLEIDPVEMPGLTYGISILTAINEMQMIDSVWSLSWPPPSLRATSGYFDELARANTGWGDYSLDILKKLGDGLISLAGLQGTAIGISTLNTAVKLAKIGSGIQVLKNFLGKRALWIYLDQRFQGIGHTAAWGSTPCSSAFKEQAGNCAERLWDSYGNYLVEDGFGLEASFKQGAKQKLREEVDEALKRVSDAFLVIVPHSPIEVHASDSGGRITGIVNSVIREEIPNSAVAEDTGMIVVFSPDDTYHYDVQGTEKGIYGLDISNAKGYGEVGSLEAVDIPVTGLSSHKYDVNWDVLSEGGDGVTVEMDDDGDGVAETIIKAGTHLEAKNTPEGTGIRVNFPTIKATATFNEVTSPGNTFVSTTKSVPSVAGQQGIDFLSPFYQFTSTADYAGDITVEISYNDSPLTEHEEEALRLFKIADDGTATDITTGLDTEQNTITGVTDSFSSFAVGIVRSMTTHLTSAGWHMITLPGELCGTCTAGGSGDLICALSDDLDPCYIFHYDPGVGGYIMAPPAENIPYHAGMGFWTRTYTDNIAIDAEVQVPTEAVEIPLGNGWNQIGNPFTFPVPASALKVRCGDTELSLLDAQAQGWVSAYLFGYDTASGGYVMLDPTTGCLQPWNGYWMRSYQDGCVLIISPTECSSSSPAGQPLNAKELQARGLELPPAPPNDLMNLDVKEVLAGLTVRNVPNPIRSEHTTTFKVEGKGAELVQAIRVEIYDQAGQKVFAQDINSKELEWHTNNDTGELLANGVYLYQVWVKIADTWYPTGVHKLAVVR